ncbi:MAG: hypothetical protein WBP26_00190 [Candidatus Saccharimonadales bacterium]
MLLLALLITLIAAGFLIVQRQQNQTLSAEDIREKFGCNRPTMDYRETDVFCGNPKFYNDPGSITKDEYYKYSCEDRLEGEPPTGSAETNDPVYDAYFNCKDETKRENLRQDFIKNLEKLKAEQS